MSGSKRRVLSNPVVTDAGPLSHEEQAELFRRMKPPYSPAVMAEARETLIVRNTPLARREARAWFLRTGREFGPLFSHASLGLIESVDRFRPELGWQFSTFATHYVRGYIIRADGDERGVIRVPAWVREKGRYAADTEFGRSARRARGASSLGWDDVATEPDAPDCGDREVVAGTVAAAVAALPERLGTVMRLRYGLGAERRTLAEVGRVVGVSKERVRQLEREAALLLRGALPSLHPSPDDLAPPGAPCQRCGGEPGPCGDLCGDCLRDAGARADARARRTGPTAEPCRECGTTGGGGLKGGTRPRRVLGLCTACYQAHLRSTPVAHFAPPKEAAPC